MTDDIAWMADEELSEAIGREVLGYVECGKNGCDELVERKGMAHAYPDFTSREGWYMRLLPALEADGWQTNRYNTETDYHASAMHPDRIGGYKHAAAQTEPRAGCEAVLRAQRAQA